MSDCTRTSPCIPDYMVPVEPASPALWLVALVALVACALIIRITNR